MSNEYVLTTDGNGDLAIRTVVAEESSTANSTDVITATTDGKLAVRVVGNGGGGGGSDPHNLGWYADLTALQTAHPTAEDGDFAILGSTDTVWVWDSDTTAWKDTDTKGQVTSVNGQTGAVTVDTLPSQTGNAGKFLTTDGTDASWAAISALQNTATGTKALQIVTETSAASTGAWSVALGDGAYSSSTNGIAIGRSAYVGQNSSGAIVIGTSSSSGNNNPGSIFIGGGSGQATEAGTFCINLSTTGNVGSWTTYKIVDSNGTIPTARLTKVNTTATLTSAGWSGGSQTITVSGVTSTGIIFVSPDPTDQAAYTSAGIIATAQSTDSITFTCTSTPNADIDVNIIML